MKLEAGEEIFLRPNHRVQGESGWWSKVPLNCPKYAFYNDVTCLNNVVITLICSQVQTSVFVIIFALERLKVAVKAV